MTEMEEVKAYILRACVKRKIRVVRYESADHFFYCHLEHGEKTATAVGRSDGAALIKAFVNLADPSMEFID